MNKLASRFIVLLLLVSVVMPLFPGNEQSHQLSSREMTSIVGGKEALDCEALAAGTYALCLSMSGGWLACMIVSAAAYLGCSAANSIAAG